MRAGLRPSREPTIAAIEEPAPRRVAHAASLSTSPRSQRSWFNYARTSSYFTLFFIPLIPLSSTTVAMCTSFGLQQQVANATADQTLAHARIVQRVSQASHNPGKLTFFAPAGATLVFVRSHTPHHQCFPRLAVHGDENKPWRWIDAVASKPVHGTLGEDRFGGDYTVTLPRSRRPGTNLPPAASAFDPDLALDLNTLGYDIFIDPTLR